MQKRKTEIITARMTPADKKAIRQRAKAAGMTITDHLTTLSNMGRITALRGDDLVQEYARLCDTLSALVQEVLATFTAIQCKKQAASFMLCVIDYAEQEEKTRWGDAWLVIGRKRSA